MKKADWLELAEEAFLEGSDRSVAWSWCILLRWAGLPPKEYWTAIAERWHEEGWEFDSWYCLFLAEKA